MAAASAAVDEALLALANKHEVPPERHAAFFEYYGCLSRKSGGNPSRRALAAWEENLTTSRARVEVEAFAETTEVAARLQSVAEAASVTGSTASVVLERIRERLVFSGIYGIKRGTSLPETVEIVCNEFLGAAENLRRHPPEVFRLAIKSGVFDQRHHDVRARAYPYRPSTSADRGTQVIEVRPSLAP